MDTEGKDGKDEMLSPFGLMAIYPTKEERKGIYSFIDTPIFNQEALYACFFLFILSFFLLLFNMNKIHSHFAYYE
jgi:hypothetical protein